MITRETMPMNGNGKPRKARLTPVQQRMLDVLLDMREHWIEELHRCLHDDLGPIHNVHAHLPFVRKYLAQEGRVALSMRRSGAGVKYCLVPLSAEMPPERPPDAAVAQRPGS